MKIEILFVPGCPNYEPAVARVKKILASEGLKVEIADVPVNTEEDARALLFPGSPTVRINDDDVEPDPGNALGLTCRLYGDRTGVPSEASVRRAVERAKGRD